jgi:predicted transcriptional regulator
MNTELKEKVRQYIDNIEGEFYPDDIAQKLDADFQEVMDICQELINEGIIEIASWRAETLNKVPKEVKKSDEKE